MDVSASVRRGNGETIVSSKVNSADHNATKTPSIDEIVNELGVDGVKPIYFVLATTYGLKERDTGHIEARHPIDSILRPIAWNLDFQNTVPAINILASHDLGETAEYIAGAMAINACIGDIFGRDYETSANRMTDYNSMILKYLREHGPKVSKKDRGITQEDILSDIEAIRPHFKDRVARQQRVALDKLIESLKGYSSHLSTQDIPEEDKKKVRGYIQNWRRALEKRKRDTISKEEAERFVDRKFDELIELLTPKFSDNTKRTYFDKRGSYTFHTAREIAYRGYVRDIIWFDDPNVTLFTRYDLQLAKVGDKVDNIRITDRKNMKKLASEYLKTEIVITGMRDYMAKINDSGKESQNSRKLLEFLEGQLVLKVLTDNYQIIGESDSVHRDLRDWLPHQFGYTYRLLGKELMRNVRRYLKKNPSSLATDPETAGNLISTYDRLVENVEPGTFKRFGRYAASLGL